MTYVAGEGAAEGAACVFCRIAADTADEANLVLLRGERAFILLNLYPYNTGHLMIAPYAHVGELGGLDPAVSADLWDLTQRAVGVLGAEYTPHGYNVGMNLGQVAGAGVPDHLHVHVVPRWNGDTNFMPVTAETKVLPEALEETYRRLRRRVKSEE